MIPSPIPFTEDLRIHPGPALLEGIEEGAGLEAHRRRYGAPPELPVEELQRLVDDVGLRGRGGAAFPFGKKLATVAEGRRPVVVVNLSEGEPASAKDSALALTRPHLVLDGAAVAARALGAKEVHVALPGERPLTAERMRSAMGERDDGLRWRHHRATSRFYAGQARAVVELVAGRENRPETTWVPDAVSGVDGRPTLLSNAETWAQLGLLVLRGEAAYRRHGSRAEPGTALLTLTAPGLAPHVREVGYGTRLRELIPAPGWGGPVLVGGFHGSWATWQTAASARISVPGFRALGFALGAGVLHAPGPGRCPLELTSRIVDYLADHSAGRCGPCLNGLPALAAAVRETLGGTDRRHRIDQLGRLLERRGACAHPDGTVRLVRSLYTALPAEMAAHGQGSCLRDELAAAS
jgi:NADH:ubiquinone oxidoreductase subunit F (NADH-binding)